MLTAESYWNFSFVYENLQQYDEAIELSEKAVKIYLRVHKKSKLIKQFCIK